LPKGNPLTPTRVRRAYGHAFDAFKGMVVDDGAALFQQLEAERGGPLEVLKPSVRDALLKNIKRRMTPQPIKVRVLFGGRGGAQGRAWAGRGGEGRRREGR